MIKLVFAGELVTGFSRTQVEQNLAELLDLAPDEMRERLFVGRPVVIKRLTDPRRAYRWRKAFADAGAVLLVMRTNDPGDTRMPEGEEETGEFRIDPVYEEEGEPLPDPDDPSSAQTEEPTFAYERARMPGLRKRNRVFAQLGMLVLGAIFLIVLALWSTKALWQGVEVKTGQVPVAPAHQHKRGA